MNLLKWLGALAVVGLVGPIARTEDKPADAAKKLEGTYTVVEILVDGKASKKADEITSVEIKDGLMNIKGVKAQEAKFTLDPSKMPMEIVLKTKPDEPTAFGIYRTKESDKGLELTIAFSYDGGDGDGKRPKDFKGGGTNEVVLKLLRKK